MNKNLVYKRILLKISGEALMGEGSYGISPEMIEFVAREIQSVHEGGVQMGLVIGAGTRRVSINLLRKGKK